MCHRDRSTASSTPVMPDKEATLSARTCLDSNGIYITSEFIWWRARGEELFFAAKVSDYQVSGADASVKVKDEEIDYQYDPGWKVGVGGNLPWDGWDLYANWTHLHNHPTKTLSSSPADIIPGFVTTGGVELAVGSRAKGSWNLMFNSIDFDWGRLLYLSDSLYIRPSFGVKAAWIHQRLGFKIEDVVSITTRTPQENVTLQAFNKYWGVGPYFAINGVWNWAWGFGLYGEISGALFWGQFKQKLKIQNIDTGTGGTTNVESETSTHRVRPTLQMFVGLDWRSCVYDNWLSVNFRAGWEVQYFWSQFVNPFGGVEESDFTLEGLTVSGRVDF